MNNIKNGTENVMNNMKNGAENTMNNIQNGTQNLMDNSQNSEDISPSDTNYAVQRTAWDTNDNFFGFMNNNIWAWIVIGIVALVVIGIIWYYMANKTDYSNHDE